MAFMKAHPALRDCSAYHAVALVAPLGRRLTTISASLSLSICATSFTGEASIFIVSFRYSPTPSRTGPFRTETFNRGTSANFSVLLGGEKMASERSFPTFRVSMSKAETN